MFLQFCVLGLLVCSLAIVLPPHILKLSTCSVSQFLPLWKKKVSKQASECSGGIIRRPEVLSPLFQASWWTWVSAWLLWPSGSVPSKWRLESDPLCIVAPFSGIPCPEKMYMHSACVTWPVHSSQAGQSQYLPAHPAWLGYHIKEVYSVGLCPFCRTG